MNSRNMRCNEPPMPEALAFLITWRTYGTWLPGDERGWVEYRGGWQRPDPILKMEAKSRMTEDACVLDREQRQIVERTIKEHCEKRGWVLHVVNCRSNHVHVVVSASATPKQVRIQFKAWCTRRLKEHEATRLQNTCSIEAARENWWVERGSSRFINDEFSLESAILYVRDGQDVPDVR